MRQARNPIWPFAHLLAGLLAMMLVALWLWQLIESGPAMGRDASPAVNAAAPLSVTTPRPAGTTKWRPAAPLQNKIKDLEEYVAPASSHVPHLRSRIESLSILRWPRHLRCQPSSRDLA